ncbi:MAG TPA: NfeD family protein [Acidimicrobiales bacterium]|jgi:membrane protein implicated in regulation of membrane protease activity|nr:NfeD family protein [Acidimicrobiales bacterium]
MTHEGGTMWAIAGVLLGLAAVAAVAGFHFGPHAHAASTVLGVTAATFLLVLAFTGHAEPLLFALLGADVAVTGGIATIAAKGFSDRDVLRREPTERVVGAIATAVDTLDPEGTVRLRGEIWSATALNPPITPGTIVHVVNRTSVRLDVWADTGHDPSELFTIDAPAVEDRSLTPASPDRPATPEAGEERTTPQ